MSHYCSITTELRDKEFIIAALVEIGFGEAAIEYHKEPVNLYGWHGDMRKDCANIIVRRCYLSSGSNDLGFVRNKDGTYSAIISDFDRGIGYNNSWLGKLKQAYGVKMSERQLRLKGFTTRKEVKQDGTVVLVAQRR